MYFFFLAYSTHGVFLHFPQVKLFMEKYFLETDEAISGTLKGEYVNDKMAYGNATVKLYVRNQHLHNWTFVTQKDISPVGMLLSH